MCSTLNPLPKSFTDLNMCNPLKAFRNLCVNL